MTFLTNIYVHERTVDVALESQKQDKYEWRESREEEAQMLLLKPTPGGRLSTKITLHSHKIDL